MFLTLKYWCSLNVNFIITLKYTRSVIRKGFNLYLFILLEWPNKQHTHTNDQDHDVPGKFK